MRKITHAAAQSVHKYVWRVKWDQGERNGWLGRSNSHPPDRESRLTSGLPARWRASKFPHCAIDPDVAFWYDYLSPAWIHWRKRGVLSLGNAQQEMNLGVGRIEKIVAGKKEYFHCRNSAVHLLLRRRHSNSTWNWFHMFSYERLFSFYYWQGILSTLPSSFNSLVKKKFQLQ